MPVLSLYPVCPLQNVGDYSVEYVFYLSIFSGATICCCTATQISLVVAQRYCPTAEAAERVKRDDGVIK